MGALADRFIQFCRSVPGAEETIGAGLVGAMQLTHALVPPTPGPLAAVALVGADLGALIFYGALITLIASIAGWIFALIIGPRVASPPSPEFVGQSFVEQGRESARLFRCRASAPSNCAGAAASRWFPGPRNA